MNLSLKNLLVIFGVFAAILNVCQASLARVLPEGFVYLHEVDPSIGQKIEMATSDNCVGAKLEGYEGNQAICTRALANELKKAQHSLKKINKNYSLRVEDAYRPVRATEHLKRWAADPNDTKTKEKCYPEIDKKDLPGKYIAAGKSSHNRGSTVDIIIIDLKTGKPLDFGPSFFGDYAHINYIGLSPVQRDNRKFLRELMLAHNFKPYDAEFWHYTLKNEPFPDTYFDFLIKNGY